MEETYAEILRTGSTASVESRIWPMEAVFEVQGALELQDRKAPLALQPALLERKA
jgi:hypothetical protein